MRKLRFLIHYDINKNEERIISLAATNKADYIVGVLNDIDIDVEIISASLISKKGYIHGSKIEIGDKLHLIKFPAFKWGNLIQKILAYIWSNAAIFFYLMTHIKKNETIIVYHSLRLMSSVYIAKKLKRFNLILETEEIYNDVIKSSSKARARELKFINCADKYIFPTQLLNQKLNRSNKPYCIIHGTYKVEYNRQVHFEDDKIHIVYAGTFDPRKGVAMAAAAAEWLPKNYHVHIIGFGSDKDTKNIKEQIEKINNKSKSTITYDGLLSGEDYIQFLQKCQIGLSTQIPDADFNDTSFPSKILSYMANGLRVVTIRIPAIEISAIGQDVYYYEKQSPEAIAEAVMNIDLGDRYDGRKRIRELDEEFKSNLKILLEDDI